MTIIYNKRTGDIKAIFGGNLQHIDTLYAEEAVDYKLIWDEIYVEDDMQVINNSQNFKINVITKEIEMLPTINKYTIASQ